jgi:hypothetical protein
MAYRWSWPGRSVTYLISRFSALPNASSSMTQVQDSSVRCCRRSVHFADFSIPKRGADPATMVLHMDPVSHVEAGAIDRKRADRCSAFEQTTDQLFRELVRAVIVSSIG